MSRFHFYAPYIKTLNIPPLFVMSNVHDWEPLVAYSENNELLPNLVELECSDFHSQALSVFPSRSTQKVTIATPSYPQTLDMAGIRPILEHVAHKCPGLYSLEFHPKPNTATDALTSMQVLSSFKDLRRLVATPVVVQS
ncbi:hypothetical protein FRC10_010667, partial [Ceratobasidium sp. 414]